MEKELIIESSDQLTEKMNRNVQILLGASPL